MSSAPQRPVTVLVCALGGEGGGVLAEWLVETATASGYAAQSTSIPGVAQRTGSTTYYFEVFPLPLAQLEGRAPVFSLYPTPGALDMLVSSELVETVRQIGDGMVSPERTLVLSSSSRTLTTAEKLQPGDGRADTAELLELVRQYSRDARIFDMGTIARETGTALSAVLFGAIAGSGVLPFSRDACEQTVRRFGVDVEPSVRGFARAFALARGAAPPPEASPAGEPAAALPQSVAREFPPPVHAMLGAGHARLRAYQDEVYADLYVQRLRRVLVAERSTDPSGQRNFATTSEAARFLALWMAFDDIAQVAQLKCRASRFARVRREVKAADGELLFIYDHFKPGVAEFAALLPARWARALMAWDRRRQQRGKAPLALPLKLGVHTVSGFLALRAAAGLKWLRRYGSRYREEQDMIDRWLSALEQGARTHWPLGHEIALCGRLIKGYGATNERGKRNLLHVLEQFGRADAAGEPQARAQAIRAARLAALADDAGRALDQTLLEHGAAAVPVRSQPVFWVKKSRRPA